MILNFLATGLVFYLASMILPSVHLKGYITAVIVAVVIALANVVLTSFLPGIMGSSSTIVNFLVSAGLIKIADYFIDGFKTDGLISALILAVLVSVISWFIPFA